MEHQFLLDPVVDIVAHQRGAVVLGQSVREEGLDFGSVQLVLINLGYHMVAFLAARRKECDGETEYDEDFFHVISSEWCGKRPR